MFFENGASARHFGPAGSRCVRKRLGLTGGNAVHFGSFAATLQKRLTATTKTLQVAPRVKKVLRIGAAREHRSIANMVEVLIRDYCGRNCITVREQSDLLQAANNNRDQA